MPKISEALMYQLVLTRFGGLSRVRLAEKASIRELVVLGLDNPDSGYTSKSNKKDRERDERERERETLL